MTLPDTKKLPLLIKRSGTSAGDDRPHGEDQPGCIEPMGVDDRADDLQEERRISSRRHFAPVDGARDHRPPLATTLVHRFSDDRFDLGTVSLVEQPRPGSAFDLPTDIESPRECLNEISLQIPCVRQRAIAKRLPHPLDDRSDRRCPDSASVDR